jgi:hypothetical protein
MAYLLDTMVISAARRADKQELPFRDFLAALQMEQTFLSSVSIMEIRFGIQRELGRDRVFAVELARWLEESVIVGFAGRILAFDLEAASRAGSLPTPDKRPNADAMIAATALENDLVVVTRNVAHFEPLGVACIDPWRPAAP